MRISGELSVISRIERCYNPPFGELSGTKRRISGELSVAKKRISGDLSVAKKRISGELSVPKNRISGELSGTKKRISFDMHGIAHQIFFKESGIGNQVAADGCPDHDDVIAKRREETRDAVRAFAVIQPEYLRADDADVKMPAQYRQIRRAGDAEAHRERQGRVPAVQLCARGDVGGEICAAAGDAGASHAVHQSGCVLREVGDALFRSVGCEDVHRAQFPDGAGGFVVRAVFRREVGDNQPFDTYAGCSFCKGVKPDAVRDVRVGHEQESGIREAGADRPRKIEALRYVRSVRDRLLAGTRDDGAVSGRLGKRDLQFNQRDTVFCHRFNQSEVILKRWVAEYQMRHQ
ncbi:hypothetical protein CHS0354_018560 [Potamilus streckersoni]|uniref:Uncharacterized protein n=1 Tax=Potamilus streckersoni TaxID=2493646 RepID=A0AAE0TBT1_9BIVA|nr:hypothetical protein CHS0354_018560 [Potamilus streckersoni]